MDDAKIPTIKSYEEETNSSEKSHFYFFCKNNFAFLFPKQHFHEVEELLALMKSGKTYGMEVNMTLGARIRDESKTLSMESVDTGWRGR